MKNRTRRGRAHAPAGMPLPESVVAHPRHLAVADTVCATRSVVGYPSEVRLGWLEPLVTHPGAVDVALHVDPIPNNVAARRMRQQLGRFESTRRLDDDRGRLTNPALDAAAEDARDLAEGVARGEARLFSAGVYATVHASGTDELTRETERLRAVCDGLLLDTAPATYRSVAGWLTTLPLGLDLLRQRRTMDTTALAAAFPFASAELSDATGVLYGVNARSSGLVFWDRWRQRNYNSVVLATSGAGKSYLTKLELLRSLYSGVTAFVIDPENEYERLAGAVGGTYLRMGAAGLRLNPCDLSPGDDAVLRRTLFLHTFVAVLLGDDAPNADEKAALDRAVVAAYAAAGITSDPRTHTRPAPTLGMVSDALSADGPHGKRLAERLQPYVAGSYAGLFDGATTTQPIGHLVVFSLRDLPDELRPAAMLLVLDTVWRQITDPTQRRRRLVVVDEAWQLMRDPEGARFLFRAAKSARKHWAGLAVVTQDAADLLATELGLAVVANAATQILLRQAPQAIPALADAFGLTAGEQSWLLAAEPRRGEGLLIGGTERVAIRTTASPAEHALVTTDPAEVEDEL